MSFAAVAGLGVFVFMNKPVPFMILAALWIVAAFCAIVAWAAWIDCASL